MQRTKSKILSILLSLVMLLSLLPTTALAAGIPDPTAVFVDEGKSFYDGRLYYKSGDGNKKFSGSPSDYIAHYDPSTGTLTLNGYSGGSISVGGSKNYTDITVVLKGTNTINGSLENAVGGDITVTSSDGGTLSITKKTSGSNPAIGIETGLSGSYKTGNVTIKGNAKVTIKVTHNGASGYDNAYGIFAKENITISENASVDITCATPNNTYSTIYCNGLRADNNVTINTDGTIKINVIAAGGDDTQSYGIYPMGNATLTKVGEMEVQWKKHKTNTSYPGGAVYKGTSFDANTYAINAVDMDETKCYASYRSGQPYEVTVVNGDLTGPGVPNASGSGMFLENDTVNITPNEKKSSDGTLIPFKEWTSEDVTLDSPATTGNNSFTVANKDVTVTATYNPFDGAPVFTRTSDSSGTIKFKTVANPDNSEFFEYVKDGETAYNRPYSQPTTTSSASPYEYSVSVSTYYAGDIKNLEAGDYRMAVTLNGERYLSDPFTVNYTAAPTPTANISLDKTGTVDFDSREASYTTAPAAETVTITNSGTAATGALTIALDGAGKNAFEVSPTSITNVEKDGGTANFTVQPKTGLSAGTYNATVKVSGPGVTEQSFDVKFIVTAPLTAIAVPTANTGLVYDGTEKTGVSDGTSYTLGGTYKAINVGATSYTATATPNIGYKWSDDGTTDAKTINWNIGKRTPAATDFTFTVPADLTYDGNDKTASVTLKSPFTESGAITVKYEKDSASVTETKDVGTYTVKIDVAGGDNFNAGSNLTDLAWTFSINRADQSAPAGLGVAAPITSGGKGKITGTTTAMEYNTDAAATTGWTACDATDTEVAPDTYYVRFKADSNHNAGAAATVTVPAYSATPYSITVTNDGNGNASADKPSAVAGETVTLTATPNSGYVFDKWVDKTPTSLTIGAGGTFTMPSENVSVKATFKPAALTGTASITGELKYGAELTAKLTGSNNTGNLHYKWYQNGTTQVAANNTGKYTLTADDIGKTITVEITSDVQTGKITSSATGTIDKADGPTAPSAFTLTFTLNADGTTFTATIPTVAGGEYSFDGTSYSTTNTKTDCAANTSYTGHVRIAETPTQKASASTSSTQTSPKLTVATPTFTPNGVSGFTGTQSVTISCATAGATIHYTTNGTAPTASSPVYSTPLSLTSTTTVKAIAVMTDMNDSAIATANFTKYSGGGGGGGGGSSSGGSAATPSVSDKAAKELKNAKEGSTVTIDMKGETKLPASVTKEIAGKDVTVELDMGGGMVWSFNGLDVPKGGVRLDLGVKTGTKTIPAKVINALTGEATTIQLQLNHNGPFGMSLNLSVDLGKKHNGMYANLYFYNSKSGELEFQSAGMISGGKASWAFDHASDYAIVIDKESHEPMTFNDVPASAYYAEAVNWAVAKKITEGVGNDLFAPNQPCTRAQIVTFLWRAAGSPAPKNTSTSFGDVKSGSFYEQAVAWAVENGITGGTGDGKFSPDATCTRAQSVTFLYRAAGSPAVSGSAEFGDVATNAYYADAVAWAAKNGVTDGIGGGQFGSGSDCTRGQIVTFLYRNYQSK